MQITFTLSPAYTGATYVAGPFNISGTTSAGTSYELATGVTKNQLTTGYTINTAYETLTGGTIQSTGTCSTSQPWYVVAPTPTPTATASGAIVYWSLAQGSASGLEITSVTGAVLLSESASGASTRSGSITVPLASLPYTVTGRWNSGSGNIVRYIICDGDGNSIYASSPIDNMGVEESYTVTPTPLVVSINVVGQNNIPSCIAIPA